MGKKFSVFEVTQEEYTDRVWRTVKLTTVATCVFETLRKADAIAVAQQSDTRAIVNTYGECGNPDDWADVYDNGKPVIKRDASPVFSRLATKVTKDAVTGRISAERLELSPVTKLVGVEDHPGSSCPHCGAEGRYVKVFECEDGQVRKAMSGCFAMWPKSKAFQKEMQRRRLAYR